MALLQDNTSDYLTVRELQFAFSNFREILSNEIANAVNNIVPSSDILRTFTSRIEENNLNIMNNNGVEYVKCVDLQSALSKLQVDILTCIRSILSPVIANKFESELGLCTKKAVPKDFSRGIISNCSIVTKIEQEWQTVVYLPFIKSYMSRFFALEGGCINDACTNPNLLHYLLSEQDKLDLNWDDLSSNRGLTIDLINQYPYKWNWDIIHDNPGITVQDIINNPEYPWDWYFVSSNPTLTIDLLGKYLDKKWAWVHVSANPGITMQDIMNHPEYPWDWYGVSANPNLTMNMIITHPKKPWCWSSICRNPGITEQDMINHPHYPWSSIVDSPHLTMKIIVQFPTFDWNWNFNSRCRGITMQDIINHPEYPWDWDGVSANPNLTMEFVNLHPNEGWNWFKVIRNPAISVQDILHLWQYYDNISNPGFHWDFDWSYVSSLPDLRIQDIIKYPKLNESTNLRDILSYEDVEDQFLRLKEICNCNFIFNYQRGNDKMYLQIGKRKIFGNKNIENIDSIPNDYENENNYDNMGENFSNTSKNKKSKV